MEVIPRILLAHARRLRRNQTKAECILWSIVRNREFGGFKFRRQKPIGPYIVDFYCSDAKVVVELDGGGHFDQFAYDQQRDDYLAKKDIKVLRYPNEQFLKDTDCVLTDIWDTLQNRTSR
jgi:very-short-patch-repair endonuclease